MLLRRAPRDQCSDSSGHGVGDGFIRTRSAFVVMWCRMLQSFRHTRSSRTIHCWLSWQRHGWEVSLTLPWSQPLPSWLFDRNWCWTFAVAGRGETWAWNRYATTASSGTYLILPATNRETSACWWCARRPEMRGEDSRSAEPISSLPRSPAT